MKLPQYDIGTVHGIDVTYTVNWLDEDYASLEVDGDEVVVFCSSTTNGFIDQRDVLEQAAEVVVDLEGEFD